MKSIFCLVSIAPYLLCVIQIWFWMELISLSLFLMTPGEEIMASAEEEAQESETEPDSKGYPVGNTLRDINHEELV